MTPRIAPDPSRSRVQLAAGSSRLFALRASAVVVCTEGSVRIEESANGPEAAGGLHRVISVRVNAGEVHGLAYGGAVRVTALGDAQVICLDPEGWGRPALRRAAAFFQRIFPKSRNNSLGALHKISK